jgi:hypothetical protein
MRLATGIVLKEHRNRYQKEQFDRFFVSQGMLQSCDDMKMEDFAIWYSDLVTQQI